MMITQITENNRSPRPFSLVIYLLVVFAYIWSNTRSLAVATAYHSSFDEVRDTLQETIGSGSLAEYWQMPVLTILGAILLWKAKWRGNEDQPDDDDRHRQTRDLKPGGIA